jgi:hypothetical protein
LLSLKKACLSTFKLLIQKKHSQTGLFALASGSYAEALRELESIQGKRDVALAVASCLVQTHKASKNKGLDLFFFVLHQIVT